MYKISNSSVSSLGCSVTGLLLLLLLSCTEEEACPAPESILATKKRFLENKNEKTKTKEEEEEEMEERIEEGEEAFPLEQLTPELKMHVFLQLSGKDVIVLFYVCREYHVCKSIPF